MDLKKMAELSNQLAEYFYKNNKTVDDVMKMSREDISNLRTEVWTLNEVPEDIYNAFHEEETFNYLQTNIKFDLGYLIRINKKQHDHKTSI